MTRRRAEIHISDPVYHPTVFLKSLEAGIVSDGRPHSGKAVLQLAVDMQGSAMAAGDQLFLLRVARHTLPFSHVLSCE